MNNMVEKDRAIAELKKFNRHIEAHAESIGNILYDGEELQELSLEEGKRVAKSVLKEFPDFPKDVIYYEGEEDEDPFAFFCTYCRHLFYENTATEDFQTKIEKHYANVHIGLDEFIYKTLSEGLFQGYNEIWEEHLDNSVKETQASTEVWDRQNKPETSTLGIS